jgi:HlyD family secretion protein
MSMPVVATVPNASSKWFGKLVRNPVTWVLLTILTGFFIYLLWKAIPPGIRTVVPVRKDIEQHLVASGRVWVAVRSQISALSSGRVVSVFVVEGQRVKRGELLVQMDDAEARADVVQTAVAVDQAGARLKESRQVASVIARDDLRQARTNLGRAQSDLERIKFLAKAGAVPVLDLQNARTPVALAEAQQNSAEAKRHSLGPDGADSLILRTALRQAKAQLSTTEIRLLQRKIVASTDAIVLSRNVDPGDVVQASTVLLVLAGTSDGAEVVFQLDEKNLSMVHQGQRALVSADAYPRKVLDAEVSAIASSVNPDRGSVEVRLQVRSMQDFLKPDMTVSIDITVAAGLSVPTLPSQTIHGATTAKPWLWAVKDGHVFRKEVVLGIQGEGSVEIVSVLDPGIEVVVPGDRPIHLGQHVRAIRENP